MSERLKCFAFLLLGCVSASASHLDASRLAVVFNEDDAVSVEMARLYAAMRGVPNDQLFGVHLPQQPVMQPEKFSEVRQRLTARLPTRVQSLLLVWSRPFAVGCMSVTTAFAAGYNPQFCEPSCAATQRSPLFDSAGWVPADTVGWWPAMLLPTADVALARQVIAAGLATRPSSDGVVYLVHTDDPTRNVRAETYADTIRALGGRLRAVQLHTPVLEPVEKTIGYFTGRAQVEELPLIQFLPGAPADHLTSVGGMLEGGDQMTVLAWLKQGATASYGTVSEPCNLPEKFPDTRVLLKRLLEGDTLLEAYWKSVAMPGQGLFVGEPLARPLQAEGR